ncbi:cell division protein ZapA [Pararhodobacter oceanensis]|uniref:Cell division protein ZapA n=1 Tax=Pararhodobacter oceanensis TaxID=2172121 RepID=A0A2T8HXX2_9RHOB|nr:cell division protein ZapA [Pararhodobacter oceanensis]PVH30278.1 cell division protein ZapA [Pararhodobacter oceanensis]
MHEETIEIGGKSFEVACQAGEEDYLRAAAAMLDTEARTLIGQIGRLPESRMLLMAGLMLADKTAGAEDRVRALETELAAAQGEIERLKSSPRERVEVPAVPKAAIESLSELAARAESLADQLEEHG